MLIVRRRRRRPRAGPLMMVTPMPTRILARSSSRRGAAGRPTDPAGVRAVACRTLPILLLVLLAAASSGFSREAGGARPNIVLVMTDDQGWAQVGFHGDPVLQAPHIDRLAAESVEMTRFYVSPVCAPTRAALMTGRYNYRTGVVDTYIGRALMDPAEVTVAEMLRDAGYRTGIFGKWRSRRSGWRRARARSRPASRRPVRSRAELGTWTWYAGREEEATHRRTAATATAEGGSRHAGLVRAVLALHRGCGEPIRGERTPWPTGARHRPKLPEIATATAMAAFVVRESMESLVR